MTDFHLHQILVQVRKKGYWLLSNVEDGFWEQAKSRSKTFCGFCRFKGGGVKEGGGRTSVDDDEQLGRPESKPPSETVDKVTSSWQCVRHPAIQNGCFCPIRTRSRCFILPIHKTLHPESFSCFKSWKWNWRGEYFKWWGKFKQSQFVLSMLV